MAQNQFINATIDPAASKKVDITDQKHVVAGGTAAAADATFSFDNTKITTMTLARSILAQILQVLAGQLPK